ncbi:esterase/lipase family protein [Spirosoma jeollabukense]
MTYTHGQTVSTVDMTYCVFGGAPKTICEGETFTVYLQIVNPNICSGINPSKDYFFKMFDYDEVRQQCSFNIDYSKENNSLKWEGPSITDRSDTPGYNLYGTYYSRINVTPTSSTTYTVSWEDNYSYPTSPCKPAYSLKNKYSANLIVNVIPKNDKPTITAKTVSLSLAPANTLVTGTETVELTAQGCKPTQEIVWSSESSLTFNSRKDKAYLRNPYDYIEYQAYCRNSSCPTPNWSDPIKASNFFSPTPPPNTPPSDPPTFPTGPGPAPDNDYLTIKHYHKIASNPVFAIESKLSDGETFEVCTDGATASFFRIKARGYDLSQYQLSLSEPLSSTTGELTCSLVNNEEMVCSYKHPDYKTQTSLLKLLLAPKNNPQNIVATRIIHLNPAPVLMVHGLWSEASAFKETKKGLIDSGLYSDNFIHVAEYHSSSHRSFSINAPRIPKEIDLLIKDLRFNGIAAGKIDYIGHSMGGILGRLYLQSTGYHGDIHKLITVNTPHFGSQLANMLRSSQFPKSNSTVSSLIDIKLGPFTGGPLDGGAVNDLQVNSPAIREDLNGSNNINNNMVPSHTIATYLSIVFDNGFRKYESPFYISPYLSWCNTDASIVFNKDFNDGIVSVTSQLGGLKDDCKTIITGLSHDGSVANPVVIQRIIYLLKSPTNISFCSNGFSNESLSPPVITNSFSSPESVTISVSNGQSINSSGSIQITSPKHGQIFNDNQLVDVKIAGTNVTEIKTSVDYSADTVYASQVNTPVANYTLVANGNLPGLKNIFVVGKTSSGEFIADTASFYIRSSINYGICQSLQSGNWISSSTWSCGHEPTATDIVTINFGHTIVVSTSSAQAQQVVNNGGRLKFLADGTTVSISKSD